MGYRGVIKEYASTWDLVLRVADGVVAALTGWIAASIYLGGLPDQAGYGLGIVLAVLLVLVVFPGFGLYRGWRGEGIGLELRALTLAWVTVLAALAVLVFLTKRGPEFSRGWFLIWLSLGWTVLVVERVALRTTLRVLRSRGFNERRIVIVRNGEFGKSLARSIAHAPWTGLKVVATFCANAGACSGNNSDVVVVDAGTDFEGLDDLVAFVDAKGIDQVWLALPLKEEESIRHVLHQLRHSTADVRYVPDMSGLRLLNSSVSEVAGFPVMNLSSTNMDGVNILIKAAMDRTLALLIVILISPLMVVIAIGVKLSSPGPVLFRQRRLGAGGEEIGVLKFRSMVVEPEERFVQATKKDPRVTRFGSFLRRTSLDELPQFFNVLRGDMSIVGPRPHPLLLNEQYKDLVNRYMLRHKVKPGITGWAQINGFRGETDTLEKMAKRVEYDLQYIENWSVWLDLKIIALTVVRGFADRNAY